MVKEWSLSNIEDNCQEKKLKALKARLGKPPSWWPAKQVTAKITEIEVPTEHHEEPMVKRVDQKDDKQMLNNKEASFDLR